MTESVLLILASAIREVADLTYQQVWNSLSNFYIRPRFMFQIRAALFRNFRHLEACALLAPICFMAILFAHDGYRNAGRVTLLAGILLTGLVWTELIRLPQFFRDSQMLFVAENDRIEYMWPVGDSEEPVLHYGRVNKIHYGRPTMPDSSFGRFLAFCYSGRIWLCRVFIDGRPRDIPLDWIVQLKDRRDISINN